MKLIKALMILSVLTGVLSLGACQNKRQATTTSSKEGYHK